MNRIILIGNGFDLAHGLETSYKHFIDDYWKNIEKDIRSKEKFGTKEMGGGMRMHNTAYNVFYVDNEEIYFEAPQGINPNIPIIKKNATYKNKFLEIITNEIKFKNWVDIEDEYYRILKDISELQLNLEKKPNKIYLYSNIDDLNRDFNKVKDLLIEYLKRLEISNCDFERGLVYFIHSHFLHKDLNEKGIDQFVQTLLDDINKSDNEEKSLTEIKTKFGSDNFNFNSLKKFVLDKRIDGYDECIPSPQNILFLSFNYTNTQYLYLNNENICSYLKVKDCKIKKQKIHIHGSLNRNDNNPIIFGYGDELGTDYKTIEKLNDNRYLENIKSIEYLKTDNYKKLLSFIESDYYQVFIFGHSCGLSDRTLLNTLFEHDNCVSIKPFYYQKKDGTDNYIELVQNISRNFNDKVKMRDRVVNKTYCEALPQIDKQ